MFNLITNAKVPLLGLSLYQLLLERTIGLTERRGYRLIHYGYCIDKNNNKIFVSSLHSFKDGNVPEDMQVHKSSWAVGDSYCLDTRDDYLEEKGYNYKNYKDDATLIFRFWLCFLIFAFIGIVNLPYELIIPIFENMIIATETFKLVDDALFYSQGILPLLCLILPFIIIKRRNGKLKLLILELLEHYKDADIRERFSLTHEFYETCPNCGAPRYAHQDHCLFCESSLLKTKE